jgi:ketosteroid isomerase-like protein
MSGHTFFEEEIAIRNLVCHWAEAVRRRDVRGVVRNHSADILMFDVPGPLQARGIDSWLAAESVRT